MRTQTVSLLGIGFAWVACGGAGRELENANPGVPPLPHPLLAEAVHLGFDPGATSLAVDGYLDAAQPQAFVISAHEGQHLTVHALSPDEDIRVRVHRLDDGVLPEDSNPTDSCWAGIVPASIGYLVELEAGSPAATPFSLEIELPRRLTVPDGAALEVAGTTLGEQHVSYLAAVLPGRQVEIALESDSGDAVLAVHEITSGGSISGWEAAATSVTHAADGKQDLVIRIASGVEGTPFVMRVASR